MKQFYLATLLALSLPLSMTNSYAETDFSNFTAELKSASDSALNEMATEVAIKINLSGTQRMLVQKMLKEALLITLDIEPEKNKTALKDSAERFETILVGLQTDDEELKVTETRSKKVLEQLTKVASQWDKFKPIVEKMSSDAATNKKIIDTLIKQSLPLLKTTNTLVKMYGNYCGENLNERATVINLSGKQRLLTQKMITELLLIANNNDKLANQEQLKKTIQDFDSMLISLIDGDKEKGLPKTEDKAILKQFNEVRTQWGSFKPILIKADTSKEALQKAVNMNLQLLATMNKTVEMYIQ